MKEGQAAGKEVNVELMILNLASLESTKNFIENFKQKNLPLHMLICNAGVSSVAHGKITMNSMHYWDLWYVGKTENNLELHFQVKM